MSIPKNIKVIINKKISFPNYFEVMKKTNIVTDQCMDYL